MENLLRFCTVLLYLTSIFCENLDLLILHNNDMHSRFEETSKNSGTCKPKNRNVSCYGGFARTAHVIREYREAARTRKGPEVIFLNAGDTYVGTAWYGVHKSKICVDFINKLKPDAMSLGNHEFDGDPDNLAPFVDGVDSPILAANIDYSREPILKNINKSVILNIAGRKVGIIGYLTPETTKISNTRNVLIMDEVPALKEESERLDKLGVKIIIALGHSGFLTDKKIAEEVPLVDVVVGGHTNTFLWNGLPPDIETPEDLYPKVITQKSGKKVPVVQAYAYTKYLGRLNTTFNENGDLIAFQGQPLLLGPSIPQEKDVLDLLEVYRPAVEALNTQVVGKSKVTLDGNANTCRTTECNFGNLVADAMVDYVASLSSGRYWTMAPIALMNGGGIRNTITPSQGEITRGELLGALPFDNRIITLDLEGKDLLKTLEIGARSNGETSGGEFLQVSGIQVTYDFSKPSMQRVVSAKARCGECDIPTYENIDPSKIYTLVTISFLVNGGDDHYVLKNKSFNMRYEDFSDIELMHWYIQKMGTVYPEVSGRVVSLNLNKVYNSATSVTISFTLLSLGILAMFSK